MHTVRRSVAAALALVAVLAVVGCSGPSSPDRTTAAADRGLPAGLPRSIPIAPGTLLAADSSGGEWRAWVRSDDVVRDYRTERALLVAAGFHTTVDNVFPGSGQGQFCTRRYCVDVDAYDDPVHGASLGYEIYRNTGLGPLT